MNDREVMMAVFKAVAATYEAVTGQPLSVSIETENGLVTISENPAHGSRNTLQASLSGGDKVWLHLFRN